MKRLSVIVTIVILMILIVFTLFGGRIYELITPKANVMVVNQSMKFDDTHYLVIPETALTEDNCVYTVTGESGFSKTIFKVHKKEVKLIELESEYLPDKSLFIEYGLVRGEMIIISAESALTLEDGDKVIIE